MATGRTLDKQSTTSSIALEHDRRIVHEDVNPTNILLSEDDAIAKLADYGYAEYLRLSQRHYPGKPACIPPEVAQNAAKQEEVSFGLVLYIVQNGFVPHPDIISEKASLIKPAKPAKLCDLAIRCIDTARSDTKDFPNTTARLDSSNSEPVSDTHSESKGKVREKIYPSK